MSTRENSLQLLSCFRHDPEWRLGIRPGEATSVNTWFSGLLALLATVAIYILTYQVTPNYFSTMLLDRGPTQHATVFLGCWCAIILLLKRRKLAIQHKALAFPLTSDQPGFVLSSQTADFVVQRIHQIAEDPHRFLAFNRILLALSNLKNLGRVSDVDDILRSLAERDESAHQTSFGMLNGFLWAIPVLGFIGTVLGLSQSMGKFGTMLESQSEVSGLIESLREITSGLSTAFETTLLALVVALFLQLWMTKQKQTEEEFLDRCASYAFQEILQRIRILPFEQQREV